MVPQKRQPPGTSKCDLFGKRGGCADVIEDFEMQSLWIREGLNPITSLYKSSERDRHTGRISNDDTDRDGSNTFTSQECQGVPEATKS